MVRNRSRRVRRWAAGAIAVAGVVDLLSAVTPPLRGRLHLVLEVLPFVATQAAGALVTLAGIGLLALARGVRRGQRRAWAIAVWALAASVVLHLVRGGDVGGSLFWPLVVLGLPCRQPPGVPGRIGPALAAFGRHRPRRRASSASPSSRPRWWS